MRPRTSLSASTLAVTLAAPLLGALAWVAASLMARRLTHPRADLQGLVEQARIQGDLDARCEPERTGATSALAREINAMLTCLLFGGGLPAKTKR